MKLALRHSKDLQSKVDCFIFSDEKKFMSNSNAKTEYVTRKIGSNAYDEKFMQFDHPANNNSNLNVWAYIGSFGKGELFVAENIKCWFSDGSKRPGVTSNDLKINRGFDGESYLHLMKFRALPLIKNKIELNKVIFVQDNASIHKSNRNNPKKESVYDLFKKEKVTVEDWPPKSPDLNVIENCWALLEKEKNARIDRLIINKQSLPKNKKEMFELLKDCWSSIDNDKVKRIYNSFFSRLNYVKETLGSNTFNYKTKKY